MARTRIKSFGDCTATIGFKTAGQREVRSASVEVRTPQPFLIRNSSFGISLGLHPDLRADTATRVSAKPKPRSHLVGLLRSERQLLANPPFNNSDWFRKDDDVRVFSLSASNGERAGVRCRNPRFPPKGNANFAWVQHFIHHLAPQGMAGFVLANGSMSSNQSGDCNARSAGLERATNSQGLGSQRDIRRALIEADLVDCMVALPGQLFYSTQIPVCLWFLEKKENEAETCALAA